MSLARALAVVAVAALLTPPPPLHAGGPRHIKVAVEYRQAGAGSRTRLGGSGGVVITERGAAGGGGRLTARQTERRVRQSTVIVTVVRDGGEALLTVATQVPYPEVVFFRDYAARAGHVAAGVAFREVGTSLRVSAAVLPDHRVRVRLTPRISHVSGDAAGAIEFTEASTEVVVPSGRPVVLGGASTGIHEVTRRILGLAERRAGSGTAVLLTATVQ